MKLKPELTPKQRRVFEFISEKIQSSIPPTVREIAQHMGFSSTGTVRDYLKALERKGYIRQGKNRLSRSIELLKYNLARIPILAKITAGEPNLAYEDVEGYLELNDLLTRRTIQKDVFALRVKGDSMIEAGIMEGDIAIIKKQPTANDQDIIAALLENNEATLKRLRYKNNKPFLEPANKNYQPIHKDFRIIGKLINILRRYA
ncbi:repressor LexA [bacterium]|nr:MAG: repressor LexA [bacterium]